MYLCKPFFFFLVEWQISRTLPALPHVFHFPDLCWVISGNVNVICWDFLWQFDEDLANGKVSATVIKNTER